MEDQCFYLSPNQEKFEVDSGVIHLDSALNELGMLSTITNSRIDYLKEQGIDYIKEQVKKKRSSNSLSSVPLCVVHMNSDFVTEFSLSKNSSSITDCELSDESLKTDLKYKEKDNNKKSLRKVRYKCRPYFNERVIRLAKQERLKRERLKHVHIPDILSEDRASPPIVSRQDSGNKSNPSSPVKSQNSLTSVGCSIFRSRSLDDLEISKLNLKEECCDLTSHGEIDAVSQRISKLHVG